MTSKMILPYPLKKVAKACLQKYPHPSCPELVSVDWINRRFENNEIHIKRLFTFNLNPLGTIYFVEDFLLTSIQLQMNMKNVRKSVV